MTEGAKRKITAIMVNYRTPDLTIAGAESVLAQLVDADSDLVIVDNASEDGSLEKLQAFAETSPHKEHVEIVASSVNGGFSAGNNLGFEARLASWFLLMNSDAIAAPGAIAAMLEVAHTDPKCGLVTPSLVDRKGAAQTSRFRRHSPVSELIDGAQTGPVTKLLSDGDVAIDPADWETPPDWVSFAAVLIRGEALDEVGAMDEGFFLYYEDCDFCRRVTKAGYTIAMAPDAVFEHEPGGTTGVQDRIEGGARLPAYYYASRSRYYRKYYGPLGPFAANVFWYSGRVIARLRALLGRPAPTIPQARGRDIWINWRGNSASDQH